MTSAEAYDSQIKIDNEFEEKATPKNAVNTSEYLVEETPHAVKEELRIQEEKEKLYEVTEELNEEAPIQMKKEKIYEVLEGTPTKVEGEKLNKSSEKLPEFKFDGFLKTAHKGAIFGVQFNNFLKTNEPNIFATVGGHSVTIYECSQDAIKGLQNYVDTNKKEIFYTCCWSINPHTLQSILAFGGLHGIIKIICPTSKAPSKRYIGHCGPINELKVHPKDPNILLSASGDRTLRLWNIESGKCIVKFGGAGGHGHEVVCADFDSAGNRIVSGGMDYSLKIWQIDKSPITESIRNSFFESTECNRSLPMFTAHYPDFTTRNVHTNIVDSVKWFGNYIFTKSTENEIICWAPPDDINVILRFDVTECTYFFRRFALDLTEKYMAIGNDIGETFVWALGNDDPTRYTLLKHKKCTTTIRQTAFSPDGKFLLCVCDDKTVFRWIMNG